MLIVHLAHFETFEPFLELHGDMAILTAHHYFSPVRSAGVVVPLAYHTVQGEATLDSLLYQKFVDSVDIMEDHVILDLNWVAEVGSKVIF